ncbi:MAG: sulfatase [Persicimonas sp.]
MTRCTMSGWALVAGGLALVLVASCSACSLDSKSRGESEEPSASDEREAEGTASLEGAGAPEESADEEDTEESEEPEEPRRDPPLPTLDEEHFEAFDLLVNRPLAHRLEMTDGEPALAVDAGRPDFVRYVLGNHGDDWMLDVELEETPAAAVKAREATAWAPLLRPGDAQTLRARVYNPAQGDNNLTMTVGETELEAVSLEPGWQTIEVEIPEDAELGGDNEIAISFSNLGRIDGKLSGGAFAWFRIGRPGELPETDDAPAKQPLEQGELTLADGEGLAWYVWLPEDAKLDTDLRAEEGCGVDLEVFTEDGEGGVESVNSTTRELVEERGERQTTAIDLSEWSGQVARLELSPSQGCQDEVEVERAHLVVPGEKPAVPEEVDPPKYVIVWMIDTLRSDYFPVHFDTDVKTPNLKKLAGEAASFPVSYVQGNESRTSHASLFTGMYPSRHGLVGKGTVAHHHELLPEAISEHGYFTGLHGSNGYVSKKGGFAQGWDYFVNNLREGWAIDGESMAEQGIDWAKKRSEKDFFFYLGTIDPHVTYRAHDGIIEDYDDPDYAGAYKNYLSGEDLGKMAAGSLDASKRERERIINLYKNEITFNDRAFGKLREGLEEADMWDDTMIVITSDHGEEFWDHGGVGHGRGVHQEMVHVPIMFYYPPLFPEDTTVDAGADVIDIYPTILDALGAEVPEKVQGKSLLPLVHGTHGGYPEPTVATHYLREYGMQAKHWKLYLKHGRFSLYDREEDHGEQSDAAADHPLASRWMQDAMGWFRAHRSDWEKSTWGVPNKVSEDFLERVGE